MDAENVRKENIETKKRNTTLRSTVWFKKQSLKTLDIRSKSPYGIKLTAYGHDEVRVFVEDLTPVNGVSYISNAAILTVKPFANSYRKDQKKSKNYKRILAQ